MYVCVCARERERERELIKVKYVESKANSSFKIRNMDDLMESRRRLITYLLTSGYFLLIMS